MGGLLAAGWYELRGRLEVEHGSITLPSVYPRYVGHSALTSAELMLREPDASGRIATLLMFFEDVESLEFFPGISPARFRMRDFSLRGVSRARALRKMLGRPAGTPRTNLLGRLLTWGPDVAERGLKPATDELYAAYRRCMRPQGLGEYEVWTRKYDTFGPAMLEAFRQRAAVLGERGPLISVLLPVYDASEQSLRDCLDSVLRQAWQKWELCVADDASPAPHVAKVLAEYALCDPRVRIARRERNGGVCEASNTALAMARGDLVVVVDPDGELRPHALLRLAEIGAADPDLAILYCDEDKIDREGKRFDPDFKPDWNPDLLCSQDYIRHLAAIRTVLAREAGGFRAGFEGSQTHDLVLRCSERVAARQIRHISGILYHQHAVGGPNAPLRDYGSDAAAAGARAVAEHLERIGSAAGVETVDPLSGLYRVRWPIPKPAPKISLIIPTKDHVDLLRNCVESILARSTYPDFELVVVDNQSSEGDALAYLRELSGRPGIRVLRYGAPFNYSAINNWAASQCDGQLLGLVNNDVEVISPDWLEEMAGFAVRSDTGAVGAMLYYPDDTIQHAGVLLGINGVAGHVYSGMPRGYHGYRERALVAQNLSVVTGACLLVRREVFEAVGGLDEKLPVEFNDVDFCLRVRQRGYRNVWTPFAELYHLESASRSRNNAPARQARITDEVAFMLERWYDVLRADPAYNPNLSLQSRNFEPAFPPRGRSLSPRVEQKPA